MNLNDYKDGNGNVEVSETLVSDIIGGINGVVESGSNANGNWVKFADGTMICTKRVAFTDANVHIAWGSLYYSGTIVLGNFPVSFIAPPIMSYNLFPSSATWAWVMSADYTWVSSSSAGRALLLRPITGTLSGNIEVIAIGRWK